MEGADYTKGESAGAEGLDFQLNLILSTLLRAVIEYGDNFLLYSEWSPAGKFDDMVLRYKDKNNFEHWRFLQAKHVLNEKNTISYEDLISGDRFNVLKYFTSYKDITENSEIKGEIDDLLLFVNLELGADLSSYVEIIPDDDTLFRFQLTKLNGGTPTMHKLNSKFIEDYQFSKLRRIVQTFISYCDKKIEIKPTNNDFKDYHVVLAAEVVNVETQKLRGNFIAGEGLSEGTQQFKKILLAELGASDKQKPIKWLNEVIVKVASGFGCNKNKKKEANDWSSTITITEQDKRSFEKFCSLFTLATNQPNHEELTSIIKLDLGKHYQKQTQMAVAYFQDKVRRWFKTRETSPLNSNFLKAALEYIITNETELRFINKTEENIQNLSPLALEFETILYKNNLESFFRQNLRNIFHIKTIGNMKVSLLKIFSCLRKLQRPQYFFINSKTSRASKSTIDELLDVFRASEGFNVLTCELQNHITDQVVVKKLQQIIQTDKRKKVIVLTESRELIVDPHFLFTKVEDKTSFYHLTETSRQQLKQRKIIFQGAVIEINSILSNEIPLEHEDIQSWDCLIDESISINTVKDDIDLAYYINRTLICVDSFFDNKKIKQILRQHVHQLNELKGMGNSECSNSNSEFKDWLQHKDDAVQVKINDNEDNFYDKFNNILILSDPAGNGKSTFTSYLANTMQKQNRHSWVTRLPLSNCSFTREEIQLTAASDNSKYDLFLMNKLFKLSLPLEHLIFKQYLSESESNSKLIFILDGFDEINDVYQRVIVRVLKYLKTRPNVKFIGISTRNQHQEELEKELQSIAYTLEPLKRENKISFLKKFWYSRGVTDPTGVLEGYAERLIDSISTSISEKDSELTAIPLQMRMIGEIYEEDAKVYLTGEVEPNYAITRIDLFGLYEQFIEKKEGVYLDDKKMLRPSDPLRAKEIRSLQNDHIELALQIVFDTKSSTSNRNLDDCIGLGIVEQASNGQYNFIHRTFAEFLIAKYLLDAEVSVTDKFQKGQLITVLCAEQFSVVRRFLVSQLDFKQLCREFIKPENYTVINEINRFQLRGALILSFFNLPSEGFNFLVELLFYRIKPNSGWRTQLRIWIISRKLLHTSAFIGKLESDEEVLLLSFKHFLINVIDNETNQEIDNRLFDYQNRLEEEGILNEHDLKRILFPLLRKELERRNSFHNTSYLQFLKLKHSKLFYEFITEENNIQLLMFVARSRNNRQLRELMFVSNCDPHFIFDNFVVNVLNYSKFDIFWNGIDLELYFTFLDQYVERFDQPRMKLFQKYLEDKSMKYALTDRNKCEIILKFVMLHRNIFSSIDKMILNSNPNENLSIIENCVLWNWMELLKVIVDAGYNIGDRVTPSQLVGPDELSLTKRIILESIRERHSDKQLAEIAKVCVRIRFESKILFCSMLQHAIITEDALNLEIFSSWITSEELFEGFTSNCEMNDGIIRFVDERFPQYRMKFFIMNKMAFIHKASYSSVIFEILGNDEKINKKEFLELMQLRDNDGKTIIFFVWVLNKNEDKWLDLFTRKISGTKINTSGVKPVAFLCHLCHRKQILNPRELSEEVKQYLDLENITQFLCSCDK